MQNRSYQTHAVVEAGLIIAIIVVLMLFSVYVPIFSMVGIFILPIPVTILYIRQNWKITLTAVFVSGIIIAMTYDPISALTASLMFGSTGVTLGYCISHKRKFSFTITLLAIVSAIITVLNLVVYVNLINKTGLMGFINENLKIINGSMDTVNSMYLKMGVNQAQLAQLKQTFAIFTPDFILKIIPAMLIVASFISAYINYIITKSILKKLRYEMKEEISFTKMYINNRIGTFLVVFVIIGLLLNRYKMSLGGYILNSSTIVLQMALLIDGVSLAAFYLRNRFRLPKAFTVILILILVFSQASNLLVIAGLIDMVMDFRKLDPYRIGKIA